MEGSVQPVMYSPGLRFLAGAGLSRSREGRSPEPGLAVDREGGREIRIDVAAYLVVGFRRRLSWRVTGACRFDAAIDSTQLAIVLSVRASVPVAPGSFCRRSRCSTAARPAGLPSSDSR